MKQLLIAVLLVAAQARADIVASCTDPKGYIYFPDGDKWQKDGITDGRYIIMRDKEGFDVVYIDAMKRTISIREDGAAITDVVNEPGLIVLITVFPSTKLVEVWTLHMNNNGKGYLMHSQNRAGGIPFENYKLFRADCSK